METSLLDQVTATSTLWSAWERVRKRGGAAGSDRLNVESYGSGVDRRLARLSQQLRDGSYRPRPLARVFPASDPDRGLAIPAVEDRVVQRALLDVLTPLLDRELEPPAWAYRPGRSVGGALEQVDRWLAEGLRFFLRTDIRHFFDSLDQQRLLAAVGELVPDRSVVRLVRRFVSAKVIEGAAIGVHREGVPQGSGLSPLLSNVYLREFDRAVADAGYPLVRYADDMLVLCKSYDQTVEAQEFLAEQLEALGLSLHPKKTQRAHVAEGFDFLGARFHAEGRGPSPSALQAVHERALEAESTQDLGELFTRWAEFHGPLVAGDVMNLQALLGCLAGAPAPSRERYKRLAGRRRRLWDEAPAWVHASLAQCWAHADRPGPLLLDAAAAAKAGRAAGPNGRDGDIGQRVRSALVVMESDFSAVWSALVDPEPNADGDGLADALGAAGRPALANIVRQGLFRRRRPQPAPEPGGAPADASTALVGALAERFVGRKGVHVRVRRDPRGHERYHVEHRGLDETRWKRHLAGRERLGLYVAQEDTTVRLACVQLSIRQGALVSGAPLDTLAAQVADTASAAVRAAKRLGIAPLLEAAGPRHRRVWVLFADPVTLRDARGLLVRIVDELGPLPDAVLVEPVPHNDRPGKGHGAFVPLPLGVRIPGGAHATFLAPGGKPVTDPLVLLHETPGVRGERVRELVRRGPLAADRAAIRGYSAARLLDSLPRALAVTKRCAVLAKLVEKAAELGHLDGDETCTLFETLGHLPDAEETLGRVMRAAGRIDPHWLARRLRGLTDHPISCARVRARHDKVALRVGCDCHFRGLRAGAYPSPVLHTLRPDEVPAFRRKQRAYKKALLKKRRAAAEVEKRRPEARSPAAPVQAPPSEPAPAKPTPEPEGPAKPTPEPKVSAKPNSPRKAAENPAPEPKGPASRPLPDVATALLAKWLDLANQRATIEREQADITRALEKLLAASEATELALPGGTLRLHRPEDGQSRLSVDLDHPEAP